MRKEKKTTNSIFRCVYLILVLFPPPYITLAKAPDRLAITCSLSIVCGEWVSEWVSKHMASTFCLLHSPLYQFPSSSSSSSGPIKLRASTTSCLGQQDKEPLCNRRTVLLTSIALLPFRRLKRAPALESPPPPPPPSNFVFFRYSTHLSHVIISFISYNNVIVFMWWTKKKVWISAGRDLHIKCQSLSRIVLSFNKEPTYDA